MSIDRPGDATVSEERFRSGIIEPEQFVLTFLAAIRVGMQFQSRGQGFCCGQIHSERESGDVLAKRHGQRRGGLIVLTGIQDLAMLIEKLAKYFGTGPLYAQIFQRPFRIKYIDRGDTTRHINCTNTNQTQGCFSDHPHYFRETSLLHHYLLILYGIGE